ncbi:uridine kinase family protein [Paeniglutamicibacter cryotolerans]|uniref:Uridine kinase n=1 Tax=Paeniglutamicibacter cryotolerans TaxID=670079 RepID=A0A839QMM1_9MICC|nr:uridine kinase [Paeniglutamicibacter cryotolerans]MBB2997020.1 uridine kinase [Paeniglutamicibacter cryotolerans]
MPDTQMPVILLGGASGSGKSYLAGSHGRPHVELDNFYREIHEDTSSTPLPRTQYAEIDWDHPGTWNCAAAVDALMELLQEGTTQVPNYSITTSSYDGFSRVDLDGGPVIAEGIFAELTLAPLRVHGVEVRALYIDVSPVATALRRFVRDVRERRKPIGFLIKRGISLFHAEKSLRERYLAAGFEPMPKRRIREYLESMAAAAGR